MSIFIDIGHHGDTAMFRFIDLFAGIGGFRIPFESVGGECVFTSEIDKFAAQTYQENFNEIPHGDITQIQLEEIPEHDLLLGGFPCQPFSLAGVSKYNSLGREHGFLHKTKGTLFFEILKILSHHKPKAFVLENVKNLRSHNSGETYEIIMTSLRDLGYSVSTKVIDAKLLVPQHRERIFLVGVRGEDEFKFPEIEGTNSVLDDILFKNKDVDPKYTISDKLWSYLQMYKEKHRKKGNGFGFKLVNRSQTSRTLSARYNKDGSEILILQRGKNPRRLTPRECARLMGFPDSFKIPVSDTQAYRQFGNAVVPVIVQSIAEKLVDSIDDWE